MWLPYSLPMRRKRPVWEFHPLVGHKLVQLSRFSADILQVSSGKRIGNHTSWELYLISDIRCCASSALIPALASDLKLIKNDKSNVQTHLYAGCTLSTLMSPWATFCSACHSSLKGAGSTTMSRKRHNKQSLVKGGLKYWLLCLLFIYSLYWPYDKYPGYFSPCLQNTPVRKVSLALFDSWGNWGLEKLSDIIRTHS